MPVGTLSFLAVPLSPLFVLIWRIDKNKLCFSLALDLRTCAAVGIGGTGSNIGWPTTRPSWTVARDARIAAFGNERLAFAATTADGDQL